MKIYDCSERQFPKKFPKGVFFVRIAFLTEKIKNSVDSSRYRLALNTFDKKELAVPRRGYLFDFYNPFNGSYYYLVFNVSLN